MANRLVLAACVILALILGYNFKDSPVSTYHFMSLACTGGWDNDHHCASIDSIELEVYVSINTETHVERVTTIDTTGPSMPMYRDDCKVLDSHNWECSGIGLPAIGKSKPITVIEGMDKGVYYFSVTNNQPPNFYNSSVSWSTYLLYKWQILTLAEAVSLSKYI